MKADDRKNNDQTDNDTLLGPHKKADNYDSVSERAYSNTQKILELESNDQSDDKNGKN